MYYLCHIAAISATDNLLQEKCDVIDAQTGKFKDQQYKQVEKLCSHIILMVEI